MSCPPGQRCEEGAKRRRALLVLGTMGAIFLALSAASFVDSRGQAIPSQVSYAGYDAVEGKRVFQAYNCMGCHTIVGNGAYFGPDLTKLYGKVGPAWLEAFLPSAGAWPTSGAVAMQLRDGAIADESGAASIDAYLEKYPDAAERVARRGGHATLMPNLPLTRAESQQLVAFLKYASSIHTEGWPPKPKVDGLSFPHATPMPAALVSTAGGAISAGGQAAAASPAEQGAQLARDTGCMACHSAGTERLVGPAWGGLYGTEETLDDGSTVRVDEAYLAESILDPDAKVVKGYVPHVMPAYEGMLDAGQVESIVTYIRSLGGDHP